MDPGLASQRGRGSGSATDGTHQHSSVAPAAHALTSLISTGSNETESEWCCEVDNDGHCMDSAAAHARHAGAARACGHVLVATAIHPASAAHVSRCSGTVSEAAANLAWLSAASGCNEADLIALATSCEVSWDNPPSNTGPQVHERMQAQAHVPLQQAQAGAPSPPSSGTSNAACDSDMWAGSQEDCTHHELGSGDDALLASSQALLLDCVGQWGSSDDLLSTRAGRTGPLQALILPPSTGTLPLGQQPRSTGALSQPQTVGAYMQSVSMSVKHHRQRRASTSSTALLRNTPPPAPSARLSRGITDRAVPAAPTATHSRGHGAVQPQVPHNRLRAQQFIQRREDRVVLGVAANLEPATHPLLQAPLPVGLSSVRAVQSTPGVSLYHGGAASPPDGNTSTLPLLLRGAMPSILERPSIDEGHMSTTPLRTGITASSTNLNATCNLASRSTTANRNSVGDGLQLSGAGLVASSSACHGFGTEVCMHHGRGSYGDGLDMASGAYSTSHSSLFVRGSGGGGGAPATLLAASPLSSSPNPMRFGAWLRRLGSGGRGSAPPTPEPSQRGPGSAGGASPRLVHGPSGSLRDILAAISPHHTRSSGEEGSCHRDSPPSPALNPEGAGSTGKGSWAQALRRQSSVPELVMGTDCGAAVEPQRPATSGQAPAVASGVSTGMVGLPEGEALEQPKHRSWRKEMVKKVLLHSRQMAAVMMQGLGSGKGVSGGRPERRGKSSGPATPDPTVHYEAVDASLSGKAAADRRLSRSAHATFAGGVHLQLQQGAPAALQPAQPRDVLVPALEPLQGHDSTSEDGLLRRAVTWGGDEDVSARDGRGCQAKCADVTASASSLHDPDVTLLSSRPSISTSGEAAAVGPPLSLSPSPEQGGHSLAHSLSPLSHCAAPAVQLPHTHRPSAGCGTPTHMLPMLTNREGSVNGGMMRNRSTHRLARASSESPCPPGPPSPDSVWSGSAQSHLPPTSLYATPCAAAQLAAVQPIMPHMLPMHISAVAALTPDSAAMLSRAQPSDLPDM